MSLNAVNITFLGTASAQPSSTRNHSSLALRLNGDVWLFDCGEATQHRVQKSQVKMGKIQKVFITHLHGDHIFGLLPLMAGRLNGAGGLADGAEDPRSQVTIDQEPLEIYGPLGTRAYVRSGLFYTHTLLGHPYVVHELRFPSDPTDDYTVLPPHTAELPGRNITMEDGAWPNIFDDGVVSVSSAPILHSIPCVGYVVTEAPVPGKMDPAKYVPHLKRTKTPMSAMTRLQRGETIELADGSVLQGPKRRRGRKIAILGDTFDPSPIAGLAAGADILIHEATNAYLPGIDMDTKEDETLAGVEERTKSRGHSTPQMAGKFATKIGAHKLVLNHFSARYRGDDDVAEEAGRIMRAIRDLAAGAFGGDVVCARDFMSFDVSIPTV
ncbi:Metallo-hydrolase/oxidoreductase [Punctularia strigosozonata HHB-11173 SS5]|uniref:Metallo-hydrolase/oxidoreductase n=1 Tax=Punctularia strigosozonata (strain HHB-11173) TaxID=741275 RepID=UPI0004416883|nr:Metallo-hydrolase/oxidoreductase [Punctularia strigosozonata HHB-11173 SS5]EIN10828.1 Metallo-hydrolase/oxidoreductase [Punctularia strigosozonata HHB-11173 SS5]